MLLDYRSGEETVYIVVRDQSPLSVGGSWSREGRASALGLRSVAGLCNMPEVWRQVSACP